MESPHSQGTQTSISLFCQWIAPVAPCPAERTSAHALVGAAVATVEDGLMGTEAQAVFGNAAA